MALRQALDKVNQVLTLGGSQPYQIAGTTLAAIIVAYGVRQFAELVQEKGFKKALITLVASVGDSVPLASAMIEQQKQDFIKTAVKGLNNDIKDEPVYNELPEDGWAEKKLLKTVSRWQTLERAKWDRGQASGQVYHGGSEMVELMTKVYGMFALSNPLHPDTFPFVRKMEAEVVRMACNLFHGGPDSCGTMTSGGTESIIMAMKAYRDRAREKGIRVPEIVCGISAHAAFDKAAEFMGMKVKHVALDKKTFQVDTKALERAISSNTAVIVGSAIQFPQGIMDDIEELSRIALKHKVGLHVDCCLGSFLIPFLNEIGYPVRPFDFALPGVSSISADTHKYGYAPKGTSVVMYSTVKLRSYGFFIAPDWTGGIYASPTIPGSRPGALIATTWAAMMTMGKSGYRACAVEIMKTATAIKEGIRAIDGIEVLGDPCSSVIAFKSSDDSVLDSMHIGDAMSARDWSLNGLSRPSAIHICVTYLHRGKAEEFLQDLRDSVAEVRANPKKYNKGRMAIYGSAVSAPDALISDVAKGYLNGLYETS